MTMKVALLMLLLVLLSGFPYFAFASNRLRVFNLGEYTLFKDALKDCTENQQKLATLYDNNELKYLIGSNSQPNFWLGLKKKTRTNVSTWSDGAAVSNLREDARVTRGMQVCGAFENNTQKGFLCSERRFFMCYKDQKYILIEHKADWCRALHYCRTHYTDLVNVTSEMQKQQVINEGKEKSFWIGLMQDEWEWQDRSCSTFRPWNESISNHNCTTVSFLHEALRRYNCGSQHDENCGDCDGIGNGIGYAIGLCSKGDTRVKIISKNFTWEQAFNHCNDEHDGPLWIEDKEDQGDVEQWLEKSDDPGPFWIGLRQSRVLGFWIWSDRIASYTNWRGNTQPKPSKSNQCGVIYKNGTWGGENCGLLLSFICEEHIVSMSSSSIA